MKPTNRLRRMNPERALAHCAKITKSEWSLLADNAIIELWKVFRAYIQNDFKDDRIVIPDGYANVWGRCKTIIDREVGK